VKYRAPAAWLFQGIQEYRGEDTQQPDIFETGVLTRISHQVA